MNLNTYSRKYNLHPQTVKKMIKSGEIKGHKASRHWFIYDLPPGEAKNIQTFTEEQAQEPTNREIMENLKIVVNHEIKKLKKLSFDQEGNIGPAHHKNLAMLMEKLTKLIDADIRLVKAMELTKLDKDILEKLADELSGRIDGK